MSGATSGWASVTGEPCAQMLRGGLVAAAVAAVPLAVAGAAVSGSAGALGAAVGAAVVVAFSGSTLVVMGAARALSPVMTLAIAMAVYTTKVSGLLLVLPVMAALAPDARWWLGIAGAAGSLAWSVGIIGAFGRLRLPVFDGPALSAPSARTDDSRS